MKLIIGNKNYSSWSLRAWLMLAAYELPFAEERLLLSVPGFKGEVAKYSKAGKVPVLYDDGLVVWDSLAICEYVSEQYLNDRGWPEDKEKRAKARSCSAEMHSSFFHLRNDMPMNCRAEGRKVEISPELAADISRIDELWAEMRRQYSDGGSWLFGEFSIADCMFAPVAFRFNTYGVSLSEPSEEYKETVLDHPMVIQWLKQAEGEQEIIEYAEVGG